MGKRLVLLAAIFLGISMCLAFAEDVFVEFEGRYWVTDLDAKAKVVRSSIGSVFDLKSDLGISDENYPEARVYLHTGPNSKIRASYTQASYSGEKYAASTVQFKGKTYTAGTKVSSDFDFQYFGLDWIWQFVNLADKVKAGPVLGIKGVAADISLQAPGLGISESQNIVAGLPVVGAAVNINPIDKISLFGEITGVTAGDYGRFFDAEAGLKLIPIKNFCITAGYRIIDLKAEDDPDYAKLRLKGPFAAATLRF